MVTGDGGIVRASSPDISQRIRLGSFLGLRSSGLTLSKERRRWWEVEPASIGRRSVMNDLAAAIGLVQLQRLDSFIRRRSEIAAYYDREFADLSWLTLPPRPVSNSSHSWYFYWIQVDKEDRDALAQYLLSNDIYTTFRYWPLHRTRLYFSSAERYKGAELAADTTLLLPMHQGLSDGDVDRVVETVKTFRPRVPLVRA